MKYLLVESVTTDGDLFECIVTRAQYKKMVDEPHTKILKVIKGFPTKVENNIEGSLSLGDIAYLWNSKTIRITGIEEYKEKTND